MKDKQPLYFRHKEPDYFIPDYYQNFINLYPEDFDEKSKQLSNHLLAESKKEAENQCGDAKAEVIECAKSVSYLNSLYCMQERFEYENCVKTNKQKFERYVKYYMYKNRQNYYSYWEKQAEQLDDPMEYPNSSNKK